MEPLLHVTHSALLKFLSISFIDASGISHIIAILGFCTSRLYCPAFSMWFNPGPPLSFPVHCLSPSYVVKTIFRDSSMLAFIQTGFNAICKPLSSPTWHLCAEVICHLHFRRNPSEINDLVYTICTNYPIFTPASVLVCCIYAHMATVNKGATSKWEKTRNSLCVDVHKSTKKPALIQFHICYSIMKTAKMSYVAKCEQYIIYM